MLENLDLAAIQECFANMDISTVGALASLAKDILEWKKIRRENSQSDTIDEYKEWLRRKEHQQLLEVIEGNWIAFESFYTSLNQSLVSELHQLDANAQARHEAATNLAIDPSKLEAKLNGFSSTIYQRVPAWGRFPVEGRVTIINRNRSLFTIKSGYVDMKHERGEYRMNLSLSESGELPGEGGSKTLLFKSSGQIEWITNADCVLVCMRLNADQCDEPLIFRFHDGRLMIAQSAQAESDSAVRSIAAC